jgi:hypothetical protein
LEPCKGMPPYTTFPLEKNIVPHDTIISEV